MHDPLEHFDAQQIEGLRNALLKRDQEHAKNTFIDLNNPPHVAYSFKKFPMLVYKHEGSLPAKDILKKGHDGKEELVHVPAKIIHKQVENEPELQAFLKRGWSEKPPVFKSEERAEDDDFIAVALVGEKKR